MAMTNLVGSTATAAALRHIWVHLFLCDACCICAGLCPRWRHDSLTERVSDMIVHAWAFWSYGR